MSYLLPHILFIHFYFSHLNIIYHAFNSIINNQRSRRQCWRRNRISLHIYWQREKHKNDSHIFWSFSAVCVRRNLFACAQKLCTSGLPKSVCMQQIEALSNNRLQLWHEFKVKATIYQKVTAVFHLIFNPSLLNHSIATTATCFSHFAFNLILSTNK